MEDGTRRLVFKGTDGHRKTVHLGTVPQRWANDLRDLVESLLQHQHHDQPIPAKVSERLSGLSAELQQRLAATGLITIAEDHRVTVGELLDTFAASREGTIKERTRDNNAQASRFLREFCGERFVDEITVRDAEDFLRYLQTTPSKRRGKPLSADTIAKHFKTTRQIFETAVRDDVIVKNPFRHVKTHNGDLTERQEYIHTATVLRVIDAAPSLEWQLLIALSRFAGLRTPSEPRLLKWADVDLSARTMRITSTKNERHAGRKYRTCPIVADLVPFLEAAAKAPREPDGFVFSPAIRKHTNLATMLRKQLQRLGIAAWEKTWHNLRFSCYSDFVAAGAAPANVSKWLGNTDAVGLRHYHDATSEALSRATTLSFVSSLPVTDASTLATVDESLQTSVEFCGDLSATLGIVLDGDEVDDEVDTGSTDVAQPQPVTEAHRESRRGRGENAPKKLTRIPTRALPKRSVLGKNDETAQTTTCPELRHMTLRHAPRKLPIYPLGGVAHPYYSPENTPFSPVVCAKARAEISGSVQNAPELAEVINAWPTLSPPLRAAVLAITRSASPSTPATVTEVDVADDTAPNSNDGLGSVPHSGATPSRRQRKEECVPV